MRTQAHRAGFLAPLILLLAFAALPAQQSTDDDPSGWELTLQAGGYDDSPEFGDESEFIDPDRNPHLALRLGYLLPSNFFLEGTLEYTALNMSRGSTQDLLLLNYEALLGYTIPINDRFGIFAVAGAGVADWDPENSERERDFTLTYGGGARIYLTDRLALRGDMRLQHVPDALGETVSVQFADALDDETLWAWRGSVGLSYHFGGAEPEPMPEPEPEPEPEPVDTDGDGVFDDSDACPATPAGARVDGRGCPIDSDGDNVFDGIDQCPNTPSGAVVDSSGCPLDDDDDGVPNGIDQCPNTSPGTEVDAEGCPLNPTQQALEEVGTVSFDNLLFDFDSADLRASSFPILDQVGEALTQMGGEVEIEIVGHTDSAGAASYNLSLSERRAEAALDYLLENFSDLNREDFIVRGQGESNPVASNDTDAGRQQNRRVEFTVIE